MKTKKMLVLALVAVVAGQEADAANPQLKKDYEGFTVWLDCREHAVAKFRYTASRDRGDYDRVGTFKLDPSVPYECQPSSAESFKTNAPNALTYERGHQVPANHLDFSEVAITQSNYMTNILPQTWQLNRGAWAQSEKIIECYRDQTELLVLGGAIWKNTARHRKNDHFVGSHNIRTPEQFWKVIVAGDGTTIAWLMPNTQTATAKNLDLYLIKPSLLEVAAKIKLPEVPKEWRKVRPKTSWPLLEGCDPG